ncbi:hypothetical protein IWQ60_012521 [Tieghemiomyces parasiticus]|uniref:Uncharacterized protein n=1 Tax=Tieghemiomyces parasiticus TaxID=78921 RepID=A0A9W7ZM32_9FUNG|nr:hypothetical protein IWQ60_012521 [Tieghemiomyces parasiticus]
MCPNHAEHSQPYRRQWKRTKVVNLADPSAVRTHGWIDIINDDEVQEQHTIASLAERYPATPTYRSSAQLGWSAAPPLPSQVHNDGFNTQFRKPASLIKEQFCAQIRRKRRVDAFSLDAWAQDLQRLSKRSTGERRWLDDASNEQIATREPICAPQETPSTIDLNAALQAEDDDTLLIMDTIPEVPGDDREAPLFERSPTLGSPSVTLTAEEVKDGPMVAALPTPTSIAQGSPIVPRALARYTTDQLPRHTRCYSEPPADSVNQSRSVLSLNPRASRHADPHSNLADQDDSAGGIEAAREVVQGLLSSGTLTELCSTLRTDSSSPVSCHCTRSNQALQGIQMLLRVKGEKALLDFLLDSR